MVSKTRQEPAREPERLERYAPAIQAAFALIVLGVYVSTLYPSVPGGDSGELIIAAYRLGVAHPPGYPLYTMLGKLATLLPLGSIAWRVNLMTAAFGAAAAAILFGATWRLCRSLGAGLLAGGLFAFSPLVWRYAIEAEVFSLNNLFLAILIALLVSFEINPQDRKVYAAAFVFGLGMANHHTLVLCGAPLLVWMVVRAHRSLFRPAALLRLAGCGLAGLTPYLYLFVRPSDLASTTWGDTSTLAGFWAHLTRKDYGTIRLSATTQEPDFALNLKAYLVHLPWEVLWIGIPLALLAIPVALYGDRRRSMPLRALFLALGTYLIVFHSLSNMPLDQPLYHEIHSRFWQMPNLIVCALAGAGLWWLTRAKLGTREIWVTLVAAAIVFSQGAVHHAAEDQSDNRLIADLATRTLQVFPPDALVISRGDLFWNSARYVQICDGVRPDLRLVDQELLQAPWMDAMIRRHDPEITLPGAVYRMPSRKIDGSYDLGQLIDANYAKFPIMTNTLEVGDQSWRQKYTYWPVGPFDRVYLNGDRFDIDVYLKLTNQWTSVVEHEFPASLPEGSWEAVARKQFAELEARRGARLLAYAITPGLEPAQLRETGHILEHALELNPEPDPGLYLNLGIYYYMMREEDPQAVDRMVRAWNQYLAVAPPNTPESQTVRDALRDPQNAQLGLGTR